MHREEVLYSSGNSQPKPTESDVEDYLAMMDILLDDERIEWAWDTIEGIRKNVAKARRITDRQKDVIDSYQRKVEDSD